MSIDFEHFWNSEQHSAFVDALDENSGRALRDILLLASLADDMLTLEERAEMTAALGSVTGLEHSLDFQTAEVIDHIDDLYADYEDRGEALLNELIDELDESQRTHALRTTLVLMKTHGLVLAEEAFAMRIANLMGLSEAEYAELLDEILELKHDGADA